jgi:hypothetical protein
MGGSGYFHFLFGAARLNPWGKPAQQGVVEIPLVINCETGLDTRDRIPVIKHPLAIITSFHGYPISLRIHRYYIIQPV